MGSLPGGVGGNLVEGGPGARPESDENLGRRGG